MKKKNAKLFKVTYILNYVTSALFYIVALTNLFFENNNTKGYTFLALGCCFICLGFLNMKNYKKAMKEDTEDNE